MKKYLTTTKSDDYGADITELVETTPENAKQYQFVGIPDKLNLH